MEQNNKKTIIAIANEKGGVAKTTTAINIAIGLTSKGKRVLLVDLDSQSHLSEWLDFSFDGKGTISEMIYQTVAKFELNPDDFIRYNEKHNIDYIPSTQMLSGIVTTIGMDADSSTVMKRMFENEYFNRYDYIIIDCSPTLDLRVTNAIVCSDKLLIPVQCDPLAYAGTDKMLKTYLRIKPTAKIENEVYILPTMFHQTQIANAVLDGLKGSYNNFVLNEIPYRTSAVNSTALKTVLVNRQSDDVGKAYMEVVDTILGGKENE